eukprot:m.706640 g.706640  ORF g.706640 m.706640 type:complete len:820 (+) comp22934_c0_seq10:347-2806(+)
MMRVDTFVLTGLAFVYLWAFASIYTQVPGLYGRNGVLPVTSYLTRVAPQLTENDAIKSMSAEDIATQFSTFPSVIALGGVLGEHTDTMLELTALCGMVVATCAAAIPELRCTLVFTLLYVLYHSIYLVGQTFLHFQWDILLLEAGVIAVIAAPFAPSMTTQSSHIGMALFKWLIFKLMFQSGVVKLTSECPTWWGFSALTVHYESQCIPTPAAWYLHHLPRWFHEVSVHFTYLIEIVVPFAYFVPVPAIQVFSAATVAFLMGLILLTGNYNFFNVLTAILAVSVLSDATFTKVAAFTFPRTQQPDAATGISGHHSEEGCPSADRQQTRASVLGAVASFFAALVALGAGILWASDEHPGAVLYTIREALSEGNVIRSLGFKFAFDVQGFRTYTSTGILVGLACGAVTLAVAIVRDLCMTWHPKRREEADTTEHRVRRRSCRACPFSPFRVLLWALRAGAATILFGANMVALTRVDDLGSSTQVLSRLHMWDFALRAHACVEPLEAANAYGLFRRMTGVGARPEVILEGSRDGQQWEEYHFAYKPGDVYSAPPVVWPHQPRLDWQMWFAALGSYQHNPWLVMLIGRILQGSEPVMALLHPDRLPFDHAHPPKYVRARAYEYHYAPMHPHALRATDGTALQGCYTQRGRRVGGACVCHPSCRACGFGTRPTQAEDCITCAAADDALHRVFDDGTGVCVAVRTHVGQTTKHAWWTRRYKGEYLRAVSLADLREFLTSAGAQKLHPPVACNTSLCRITHRVRPILVRFAEGFWLLPGSLVAVAMTRCLWYFLAAVLGWMVQPLVAVLRQRLRADVRSRDKEKQM